MKKLILSIFIMGSFGFYVLYQSQNSSLTNFVESQPVVISKNNSQVVSTDQNKTIIPVKKVNTSPTLITPTPSPTPVPVSVPKKNGIYNDGTYTGSIADAYYGNVQVEAVITNNKISDVRFLDYPQDRSTSRRINSYAMPYLTQEAIQVQSANVNGVSGASDTSAAFKQSLASALAKARI
jgi:uncharacterized protein with FMN-binding domain